jgi:ferrous iron transport protein A
MAPVRLTELEPGRRGRLTAADSGEAVPLRLRELGFVAGTEVSIVRRGPLGDPVEIELRGYRISVRGRDLEGLRVVPVDGHA